MSEKQEIAMIHWSGKCTCGVEEWGACADQELAAAAIALFRRGHSGEGHKLRSWKIVTGDGDGQDWRAGSFKPPAEEETKR
jgi:hypothetical protein